MRPHEVLAGVGGYTLAVAAGFVMLWTSGYLAGRWSHVPSAPVAWSAVEVPDGASCWDSYDETRTMVCVPAEAP